MNRHLTPLELESGLGHIRQSPADDGRVEMIVIRPRVNERTVLEQCQVSARLGVQGDDWAVKCWKNLPDGSPHPDVQVAIMNSRVIDLVAVEKSRWALAGDNLFVDLDLSTDNLRAGQRLAVGTAILEITSQAHNGCSKFTSRYGKDAMEFVNSPVGKKIHLRGIYAKVVQDGVISTGDRLKKL